ncbi:DUF4282 domain-containing protein [Streptomonospora nanhaiensis]|uniref:DUF4282 domain-containing protein n=1 Tax=Streptomonospora nanhaiensis TaxID=1323731 RepID=A0A853BWG2_9ACTN|nr:DUF4282 domain-containing protein [Streptomonospora nanhaiensis]MBV2364863.1 DUF4282 domain-containing protein [Streptomonospora nanhaiensis]NYI98807.1 hypothetical protein [Streptomonospora nanhaiensis]
MNPPGESPYEPGRPPYDPGASDPSGSSGPSGPQHGWSQQPHPPQQAQQGQQGQQPQQSYAGPAYDQAPPHHAHAGGYGPPPPPGGPAPVPPPAPGAQAEGAGFLGGLFDLRFRTLVATQVTRVLFVLALVLIGISTLSGVVGSFGLMAMAPFDGLLTLLGSLVGGAVAVLVTRVVLEMVIVVFRIGEDLAAVRARGGR